MHVVHIVCSAAFAGVERYIASLAPRLAERGLEVSVVGGEPASMRTSVGGGVRFSPATTIGDAVRAVRGLPRVDILNTHMSDADLAGLILSARRGAGRLVSTRHFSAPRGGNALVRRAFALADSRFAAQVSISEFVARSIGSRSTVIHTGVEDAPPHDEPAGPVVLVAQRLEVEKDTDTAVRAWALSRGPRVGWRLQIAGTGSQSAPLRALAGELGVSDSVDFLGFRDDVGDLMARASIFLAPTPREGLGLSVLEAMAHGTAVVASAAGGHLETVGRLDGAQMFAPHDAASAALAIDSLVERPEWAREYGSCLRDRQRAAFGIDRQVDEMVDFYARVVEA